MICNHLQYCCSDEQYTCKNKRRCIVFNDDRTQAVCTEKKKRYNLINNKKNKIA